MAHHPELLLGQNGVRALGVEGAVGAYILTVTADGEVSKRLT